MEPIHKANIKKVKNFKIFDFKDSLIREVKLELVLNDKKIGALMATPIDQKALAIGYLMSENIIQQVEDIDRLEILNDGARVEIEAKVDDKNIAKTTFLRELS